ncbi:unnamed protein product [Urochloa humidicola]
MSGMGPPRWRRFARPVAYWYSGGSGLHHPHTLASSTSRWQLQELVVSVAALLFPAGLRSPEMAESLKLKGYQEVMDTMVMPWTHDSNYYNGMDEEESYDACFWLKHS